MPSFTIIKEDETCGADEIYGPVLKCGACAFSFIFGYDGSPGIPNFCPNCGLRNDGPRVFARDPRHSDGV